MLNEKRGGINSKFVLIVIITLISVSYVIADQIQKESQTVSQDFKVEHNFIDPSAKIDSKNVSIELVAAYNILGLDYAKSVQAIKLTNPKIEPKTYTIIISYPKEHAHFEKIIFDKNISRVEIKLPNNLEELTKELKSTVKPNSQEDYSFQSYNITLPANYTINMVASITHDNIDSKRWHINIIGSSGGTSLLYTSGKYKIYDVGSNIWWRRISVNDSITANTILDFPHYIDFELDRVHPARVQWKNDSLVSMGGKWGGTIDELKIDSTNNSEVNWKTPINLNDGDELRIGLGKKLNFTGDNNYETKMSSVRANLLIVPGNAIINITGSSETTTISVGGTSGNVCGSCSGGDHCDGNGAFNLYEPGGGSCTIDSAVYNRKGYNVSVTGCSYTCSGHGCSASSCTHSSSSPSIPASGPGQLTFKCDNAQAIVGWNDAGSGQHYGTITASGGTGKVLFAALNITFNISDTEIYSKYGTWWISNETEETTDFVGNLSVGDNNLTFTSQTGGDLYVYFTKQEEIEAPNLTGIPDANTTTIDDGSDISINLWDYAYDNEDNDSQLNFTILSQTNATLINCSISMDKFFVCSRNVTSGFIGSSLVNISVEDMGGLNDTDATNISVLKYNYWPYFSQDTSENSTLDNTTIIGDYVNFTANISDKEGDKVRLLICDSYGITEWNCTNVTYCKDPSSGGTEDIGFKSCVFNTTYLNESSYVWTSYACDNKSATSSRCTEGVNGTFYVSRYYFNLTLYLEDDIRIWNYSGYMLNPQTVENFTDELISAQSSCTEDADGYCNISLDLFSNKTGLFEIYDIQIYYNVSWNREPVINWFTPYNSTTTIYENTSLEFNQSSYDPDGDSLTYNWTLDGIQQSINESWLYTQDYASAGEHNITLIVSDSTYEVVQEWNITVSDADRFATLTLVTPENNNVTDSTTVVFDCSATDDYELSNMTLYHNIGGTFEANETKSLSGTSDSETFTLTNVPAGTYEWNCRVYDNDTKYTMESENYVFTVTLNSYVSLTYPLNNSIISTSRTTTLNYTVSDPANVVDNCSLFIDDVLNQTETTITEDVNQNFSLTFDDGTYDWKVGCYNDNSVQTNSTTYNLSITYNNPPIIIDLTQNETEIYQGEMFDIRCLVSDTETANESLDVWIEYQHGGDIGWHYCESSWNNTNQWWECTKEVGYSNYSVGYWDFRCNVSDGEQSSGWTTDTDTLNVIDVRVDLVSPTNNSYLEGHSIDFIFNISSETIQNCTLWLNDAENETLFKDWTNQSDGFDLAGLDNPYGMTSNGSDLWVVELHTKVYHFDSDNNQVDDFLITNGIDITTNGSDFWVAGTDGWVSHYNSEGDNQTDAFEVPSECSNSMPYGLTTNGSDFWFTCNHNEIVHTNKTGGFIDEFSTSTIGASATYGITTNGSDFWFVDTTDNFIYHTNMSGYNLTGYSTSSLNSNNPKGVATPSLLNKNTVKELWFSDITTDFAYHVKRLTENENNTISLDLAYGVYNWSVSCYDDNSVQGNSSLYYLTVLGDKVFSHRDTSSNNVASFYEYGLILAGSCYSGDSCANPSDNSFIIQDSSSNNNSYINATGDLCLEIGGCDEYNISCIPPDGSFIIQDNNANNVTYIDSTGDLCLIGELIENGNP